MVIMASILAVISDQVWVALIAAFVSAVTSIPAIVLSWRTTNKKLDDLKESTDGKLTELMAATSRADKAESHAEGRAEQKLEAAAEVGAHAGARSDMPDRATPSDPIPVKIEAPTPVPVVVVETKK